MSRRWPVIVGVVVGVLAIGTGAVLLVAGGGGPSTDSGGSGGVATAGRPVASTVAPTTTTTAPAPTTTAAPAAPAAGPPYPVGVARVTVEDPSRGTAARGSTPASTVRRLPLTVRYPAVAAGDDTAATAGSYPLVVFAHGYDIAAADYAAFLGDLAAQGFVVVAPDFPRSSTAFPGPPTQDDIDEQARDVGFLVTTFQAGRPSGPWSGHVATGKAGVVGHSDGGNTVARAASNSCCASTQIGAAAVLSGDEGTSGGQWGVASAPPMLFVQGTADPINPWSLSQQLYDDARAPKTLVAIDGAGHLEPYTTGPQRPAIVALVAAFLRARLVDPAQLGRVDQLASRDGLSVAASA